jgi:nitric oxide synthase oxygenase domain/subunit
MEGNDQHFTNTNDWRTTPISPMMTHTYCQEQNNNITCPKDWRT